MVDSALSYLLRKPDSLLANIYFCARTNLTVQALQDVIAEGEQDTGAQPEGSR